MKLPAFKAQSAFIQMFGTKPLWDADRLEALLKVFESNDSFAPQFWSRDERTKKPYSREDILGDRRALTLKYRSFYLKRQKVPKYFADFDTGVCPSFYVEIDSGLTSKHWQNFYELADQLAGVFEPDIALSSINGGGVRTTTEDERHRWSLVMNVSLMPVDYQHTGLKGLAVRTHFGPHYVQQIGSELLRSTPGVSVCEQSWGGMRIDLAGEPWMLEPKNRLALWEAAMSHIRQSGVFANYTLANSEPIHFKFTRGPNCIVGNRVPWDQIPEEVKQDIGYHNAHHYPGGGAKPKA